MHSSIRILKQKSSGKTYYYLIENRWDPISQKRKRVRVNSKSYQTVKAADIERSRIMSGISRRDAGKFTFKEVAGEFEREYIQNVPERTARSFKDYIRYAIAFFGNNRIDKIDRIKINEYKKFLDNGKRGPRTIEIAVRIELRKVFKFAVKMGYIHEEPIFDPIKKSKSSLAPETLSREQLCGCLKAATKKERFCILFMLYTAIRAEEFSKIRFNSVYSKQGYIAIKNERHNKEQRKIPVTRKIGMLINWAKKNLSELYPYDTQSGFGQAMRRVSRCTGTHITPTILRKTSITMYVSGGDWLTYSKIIGHKDPKTTAKYYFALDHERVKSKMDAVKFR